MGESKLFQLLLSGRCNEDEITTAMFRKVKAAIPPSFRSVSPCSGTTRGLVILSSKESSGGFVSEQNIHKTCRCQYAGL